MQHIKTNAIHNQQAKLAFEYNELVKELSSPKITRVGCYELGETIGEGSFGKVKKGIHQLTGRKVAVKKMSKQHASMMAREIYHHRQLKHPNIVSLYEVITTESAIYVVSEYCPNGDLLDALESSGGRCFPERVHRWFSQLIDAVHYCHSNQIVHRDLKLENILLDANDNVKICDFGFARHVQKNQQLETFCGSQSYSAPEILSGKKYLGPETDIWSLGVILYTLLAGEFPFDDDSETVTQQKILQLDYQIPYDFSSSLADLIQRILQLNPLHRLSIPAILQHPWLQQTFHDNPKHGTPEPCLGTEQKLAQTLQSAGFDAHVLEKMRTGQSDMYSTLWHHLLENITPTTPSLPSQALTTAYPPPQPPVSIQTVGFGSPESTPRPGWFASVKSWFGQKPPPPGLDEAVLDPGPFDTLALSSPTYRPSSRKHRRKQVQFSEPAVNELDQLNYNGTPRPVHASGLSCAPLSSSPVAIPPAAFTSRALAETYILDALSQPKEIVTFPPMHTPPPSPPATFPPRPITEPPVLPQARRLSPPASRARFELNSRHRLPMGDRAPMGSRTIIEEEEEEEE